MEIKVDDRVKVIYDKMHNGDGFTGHEGILVEIDDFGDLPYGVLLDGLEEDGLFHFEAEELEVIQ